MSAVGMLALITTLDSFAAGPGQARRTVTSAVFPHMDAALGYLRSAEQELKQGEPKFAGHRISAMKHTEAAIVDLRKGMDEYLAHHPGTTRSGVLPAPPPEEGARFPHMEGALKLLQQAEAELSEAAKLYNGQRVEGLAETRAAVSEIQTGLREVQAGGR